MDFAQLQTAFEAYTGGNAQVDAIQLALWFNEALIDLSWELGPVSSVEPQPDADGVYQPPDDLLSVLICDSPYQRRPDGALLFDSGASGRLWYRALPTLFSGTDSHQACPLHASLHYLPALFAASRYWDMESEGDSEESQLAAKWLGYYFQGKNSARALLETGRPDVSRWSVV